MTAPSLSSQIPVVVITGFLGAGKTTLLQKLVRRPELRATAVIINEFGEIGLDHDLLETGDETVVELDGGCLCCTVRSDLVDTLRDLHGRHIRGTIDLERVVIETTGLADPAPILATLLGDVYAGHYFRLASVVTLVDAVNGRATLDAHPEAARQVAVADRLVLTKVDMAPEVGPLRTALRQLNPTAPVIRAAHGEADPDALLEDGLYDPATKSPDVQAWLRAEAHPSGHDHGHPHTHEHDVNRHGEDIRAFCLRREAPVPTAAFDAFMDLLWMMAGSELLRVKGLVCLAEEADRPLVFHAVQHAIHPTVTLDRWPSADRSTRIVFIVRNIAPPKIEAMLDALIAQAPEIEAGRAAAEQAP
ncbi:MAG: GTP-binding protein [Pseudomonadota bacterium]